MSKIRRVYVEKKNAFAVEAKGLLADLRDNLQMKSPESIRILVRYDLAGLTDAEFEEAKKLVLSEAPTDVVMETADFQEDEFAFAVELLPGQYDQREDFAEQCIQLITQKEKPVVAAAKVFVIKGKLSAEDKKVIENYLVNPIEARIAALELPETLEGVCEEPAPVKEMEGFRELSADDLEKLRQAMELAMSREDFAWIQKHFKETEKRNPTLTEIKVLDTYWSDHCRHTTFMTDIDSVEIEEGRYSEALEEALKEYLEVRDYVYGENTERPVTLMDMASIVTKELKKAGKAENLDESEEINACSFVAPIDIDGKKENWLIMFKNETHNHPTEIEPFGGAATCLGGAIRDPLSGRAYVYQAMRVTGAGNPHTPMQETLSGKLPQRKLTLNAAAGYSSYGNQIGLATGQVQEYYNDRFVAKRMEVGAVVGAAPQDAVVRKTPAAGDVVILLGGRTGRDGIGGATGSSKEHTVESLTDCGAEVQKGNPPTERKIQRLFRNPAVTLMIKRCNDFGAGGVSVAIGELADGLKINLDKVTKKYEGLDGTELALSESQERMAVVVAAENAEKFIAAADKENLEATIVAEVTEDPRLVMFWRGDKIVDISRAFLDTNGVTQHADVIVELPETDDIFSEIPAEVKEALDKNDLKEAWLKNLADLNVCSQKGLVECFDSTIGSATVQMPFGGKNQLTPSEAMIARVPVLGGKTDAATAMAHGYNPEIACKSPFHGAIYAVLQSLTKLAAVGADPFGARLSLQEYFKKLSSKEDWGLPFAALLGADKVLRAFGVPAIGGKDSMSGTFMDIHVPPTLVSFAINVMEAKDSVSSEFKKAGEKLYLLKAAVDENDIPDFDRIKKNFALTYKLMQQGKIISSSAVETGGIAAAVTKMCLGNGLGFAFAEVDEIVRQMDVAGAKAEALFSLQPGALLLSVTDEEAEKALLDGSAIFLGETTDAETSEKAEKCAERDFAGGVIKVDGITLQAKELLKAFTETLDDVFPAEAPKMETPEDIEQPLYKMELPLTASENFAKPRVFIPVFPGINCEYDSARAFEDVGAVTDTFIIRNLTAEAIEDSVATMVEKIDNSQIIMLPGGFSAGDEPDGSGKFIATMFRNPRIAEAVNRLLKERDGLVLGICNGFQALIKLGLVPYGEIRPMEETSPTLTFNTIGRHVSQMVYTKVVSNKSPWLAETEPGEIFTIPVSHGEGRFYAPENVIKELFANGQVGTQYVDLAGKATMESPWNPNGSLYAVESICSPDGRVLGKMGHSERFVPGIFRNVPGEKDMKIFKAGVNYFKD